jgi:hypothetical protein
LCFYASFFAHGDEILGLNSCLLKVSHILNIESQLPSSPMLGWMAP